MGRDTTCQSVRTPPGCLAAVVEGEHFHSGEFPMKLIAYFRLVLSEYSCQICLCSEYQPLL